MCLPRYEKSTDIQIPTLLQQIPDNPWMEDILKTKANDGQLSEYGEFLWHAMKQQPLPEGGIQVILSRYSKNSVHHYEK